MNFQLRLKINHLVHKKWNVNWVAKEIFFPSYAPFPKKIFKKIITKMGRFHYYNKISY